MNLLNGLVGWWKMDSLDSSWFLPTRYGGNPIINYGGGGWKNSQVQEPVIMVDPSDSSKLIMFFAGMAAPVSTGVMSIARATASISNPFVWSEYASNPIISDTSRRLDSVIYDTGSAQYYLYSSNMSTNGIDLCMSSDGINFTITSSVLTPTGQGRNDGTHVSQGTVVVENGTWYMFYSYRNGGIILPGIRYATSSNGVTWSKAGNDVLATGSSGAGTPDSTYVEWHSISKINSTFFMVYEAFNGTNWTICGAYTNNITGSWTKSNANPLFRKSGTTSAFDEFHVATPFVYTNSSGSYLYYQGANLLSPYGNANWAMGVAMLTGSLTSIATQSVIDSSLRRTHGTGVEASTTYGKIGQAFVFNGTSSVAKTNTMSLDLSTNKDFTYNIWIKPSFSSTSNVGAAIFDFTDGAYTRTYLRWENATLGFYCDIANNVNGSAWRTGAMSFNPNEWHMLTFVHTGSNNGTYYFDGQPVTTTTVASTARTVQNNAVTLGFGAVNSYYWRGQLDDARIYDRVLSASEILYLYNSVRARQANISWS